MAADEPNRNVEKMLHIINRASNEAFPRAYFITKLGCTTQTIAYQVLKVFTQRPKTMFDGLLVSKSMPGTVTKRVRVRQRRSHEISGKFNPEIKTRATVPFSFAKVYCSRSLFTIFKYIVRICWNRKANCTCVSFVVCSCTRFSLSKSGFDDYAGESA